jgi:HK97 gp10 family phage protein
MAAVDIEVRGIDALLKKFDDMTRSFADEIDAAVESGAQLVMDTAVTLVPVRTGNLLHTIHVEPRSEPLKRIVRAGGGSAPYAPMVEYGTRKMGAQPYMRPSAMARRAEIVELIRKAVAGILKM